MTFSWAAPAWNGGRAITSYEIQWDQGTGIWAGAVYNAAYTSTSLVVSGLIGSTTYNFKILAINIVGKSALTSAFAIATISSALIPDPPT